MVRVVKLLVFALVAVNLLYYAAMYSAYEYPSLAAYSLGLIGRGPQCPLSEVSVALEKHIREPKAVERLLKQSRIRHTDPAGMMQIETPMGTYWHPGTDTSLIPRLLAQILAQEEFKIYESGRVKIQPGDIVLDCGAHVGVYTRQALGAGARLVVAIEPAPDNVECLRRNFSSEVASGRVIVYPKGVWDKDDFLTLYTNPNSAGDSFVLQSGETRELHRVPLTTIDKLTAELRLERVDFIKMDIKGAEREALAGAKRVIALYKPRLAVAAEHLPDDPERLPAIIRAARPDYQMGCGSCFVRNLRITPEVLLFY